VLDQKPLATPALIAANAYEHPAALQPLAVQHDLEVTALVTVTKRFLAASVLRVVRAAIPQHHRSAAVLTLGNRPLEGVVLHGVILHLHGESFH